MSPIVRRNGEATRLVHAYLLHPGGLITCSLKLIEIQEKSKTITGCFQFLGAVVWHRKRKSHHHQKAWGDGATSISSYFMSGFH
ncbi:unnamed protein product [Boreogadus saida]